MDQKYYQHELDILREEAVAFSAAYPTIAPQLSGPRPDPDVERILEGVAYLTGQIRSTLDEGFPEFAQGILNQVLPHYLRPIPSATIMKFNPKNILKGEILVPKSTYVDSKPTEGINCRFKTIFDVSVLPLIIERVGTDSLSGNRKSISLEFEFLANDITTWKQDTIRLHIGGDYAGASDLYYLLLRYVEHIELSTPLSDERYIIDNKHITEVGYTKQEDLLQYPQNSFPAYQLIQEYFLLKEKFLYIDVGGLLNWKNRPQSKKFTLTFVLKDIPINLPKINHDRFLLNTVPAINLFATDAEPILLDNRKNELRVKPVRDNNNKVQVYSVDSVQGKPKGGSKATNYIPLNMTFGSSGSDPVYQITYRNIQDGIVHPYMTISYPDGYKLPDQETLSIQVTCTNGTIASSLRSGDITIPTSSTSELIEFVNILPPTEYQLPPYDSAMLWKLLSHLSLNYLPIANVNNLRSLLGLYVFSGGDKKTEVANKRKIAGIQDIVVKLADRLVKGTLMRGQEIEVTVDKDNFSSHGDLFVFGTVLDRLFASFSSVNVYTILTIKDANSREHYEWPARLGLKLLN